MKPAPFDYHAAGSIDEAVVLLAREDVETRVLAGGQSLIPMLNLRLARPAALVDITRIAELQNLSVDDDGNLNVGAAVTQSEAMAHPLVRAGWPVLATGLGHIGHQQIRNRGTVCGNLAHNDPSSELPAIATALDATFTAHSCQGSRIITADAMFTGPFSTSLKPGELLKSVSFPKLDERGWSFQEIAPRQGDYATVGAVAVIGADDAKVTSARIVLFGVGAGPVRIASAESELLGSSASNDAVDRAAECAVGGISPSPDAHASAQYRLELAHHLVRSTINEAWERAQ